MAIATHMVYIDPHISRVFWLPFFVYDVGAPPFFYIEMVSTRRERGAVGCEVRF